MRQLTSFGLIGMFAALGACSDSAYDPNAPALDPNAPRVHITSPARGTIAGDVKSVTVTGTATDDTAVASVTVNDIPAAVAPDGTFSVQVPRDPAGRRTIAPARRSIRAPVPDR